MNTYSKDKDQLFKWILTTIAGLSVTILLSINSKLSDLSEAATNAKKDIQYIQAKNVEQDARLDKHEQVLFLKPEELKLQPHVQ